MKEIIHDVATNKITNADWSNEQIAEMTELRNAKLALLDEAKIAHENEMQPKLQALMKLGLTENEAKLLLS